MKESRYNVWTNRGESSYVFNGLSGALLRMRTDDRQGLERFLSTQQEGCSLELLENLVQGRMLIANDSDEIELLVRRYKASRFDKTTFCLTIVTSLGCNFDCPYCFEAKHPSIMDDEVQQAVLKVLDDQLPQIRSFVVNWFGGEPLVGKKPLLALSDTLIERCDRAKVHYLASIITNGFLLDEQTCRQLRDRRVSTAQVTLDGPPEVHDRMRPLANGKGSFSRIVQNLHHAVNHLQISIRVNIDTQNLSRTTELLQILAAEGFAGKLTVYPGQLVGNGGETLSPSAIYRHRCLTNPEFARAELEFQQLAKAYNLCTATLPRPTGAPCTAVRANELVVGSKGELYKCWESVGQRMEVIGDITDYSNPNTRLQKWLKYDPFQNDECGGCIALPVCMGGCAKHAMDPLQYENRCGTFRHNFREQVLRFVEAAEQSGSTGPAELVSAGQRMESR